MDSWAHQGTPCPLPQNWGDYFPFTNEDMQPPEEAEGKRGRSGTLGSLGVFLLGGVASAPQQAQEGGPCPRCPHGGRPGQVPPTGRREVMCTPEPQPCSSPKGPHVSQPPPQHPGPCPKPSCPFKGWATAPFPAPGPGPEDRQGLCSDFPSRPRTRCLCSYPSPPGQPRIRGGLGASRSQRGRSADRRPRPGLRDVMVGAKEGEGAGLFF